MSIDLQVVGIEPNIGHGSFHKNRKKKMGPFQASGNPPPDRELPFFLSFFSFFPHQGHGHDPLTPWARFFGPRTREDPER